MTMSATPEACNEHGQPIGRALPDWQPPPFPQKIQLQGIWCRLEPLDPANHAAQLHESNSDAPDGRAFTYLFAGPFATLTDYRASLDSGQNKSDPMFFAIIVSDDTDASAAADDNDAQTPATAGQAVGIASLMRIDPPNGVIEIGHINLSPRLQRTRAATEALTLLIGYGFALGYRRFEWKCDSLNAPSRAAALRLGFKFEGIFRQAVVTRGRNRDTAWYSIIDDEWPTLAQAYAQWLTPDNFDDQGRQRKSLRDLTAASASAAG